MFVFRALLMYELSLLCFIYSKNRSLIFETLMAIFFNTTDWKLRYIHWF